MKNHNLHLILSIIISSTGVMKILLSKEIQWTISSMIKDGDQIKIPTEIKKFMNRAFESILKSRDSFLYFKIVTYNKSQKKCSYLKGASK